MRTILCYGDSNTYGLKSDLVSRYSREERWTGILQARLGAEYYVIEEGLGGRTTVWDDPLEEHKNGKKYLLPCLDSHKPIDLVILILGTNDLKRRFSVSAAEVAMGMENLVKTILKSDAGVDFQHPEILLIPPIPIRDVGQQIMNEMIPDGVSKSRKLAGHYQIIAENYGIYFLDTEEQIEVSEEDGIHYSKAGHEKMAQLIEKKIGNIYEPI